MRVPEAGPVTGRAWVRAPDTVQAATLVDRLARPSLTATASSVAAPDLVTRAGCGRRRPGHRVAGVPTDEAPALTLAWPEPARVDGLRLDLPDDGRRHAPAGSGWSWPRRYRWRRTRTFDREVGDDGVADLPAVRARGLRVTLLDLEGQASIDSVTAAESRAPAAVAEVVVDGAPATTYTADAVRTRAAASGRPSGWGTPASDQRPDLRARPRRGTPGGRRAVRPAEVDAGEVAARVEASFTWLPLGLVLSRSPEALGEVDDDRPAGGTSAPAPLAGGRGLLAHRWSSVDLAVPGSGTRTVALAVPAGAGLLRPRGRHAVAVRDRRRVGAGWHRARGGRAGLPGLLGRGSRSGWPRGRGCWAGRSCWACLAVPRARRRRDQSRVGRSTQA